LLLPVDIASAAIRRFFSSVCDCRAVAGVDGVRVAAAGVEGAQLWLVLTSKFANVVRRLKQIICDDIFGLLADLLMI
jgi:hypothetical protein